MEQSLLEKQLLQLRRMKRMRKGKRQGQYEYSLLEKQLLQRSRIDRGPGERKQPFGPQKLRL